MLYLAVIAQPLAVIGDNDDRLRPGRSRLESLNQPSQLLIHRGDLAEIWLERVTAAEWLRRRVGCVRIEVVHPQEERLRGGA